MPIHEYPLTKANRIRLACAFHDVPRVDLSIDCVIEAQMGKAFVDDLDAPTVFKIQSGPFFYLAGDVQTQGALEMLRSIQTYTLFMPSGQGWLLAAKDLFGRRLQLQDRYSFSSSHLDAAKIASMWQGSSWCNHLHRMDGDFAAQIWGQDHFIDLSDYDSPEDFGERGLGYYASDEATDIVGAAFASLVCSRGGEISIYVVEAQRRSGLATALAARLLHHCLDQHIDPHWDAANPASCKLALKLGYLPSSSYEAYYLAD